jgi:hypothetical protein
MGVIITISGVKTDRFTHYLLYLFINQVMEQKAVAIIFIYYNFKI